MFYKVATTASTCSLATLAWQVNINLLLIISRWWKSSSDNFSSRDQARAADGWSSDSDAGASAPRPLESALVGKRSSLRVHIQKQRDTVCSSSSATQLPWQSIWQTNTHSPRMNAVMAMSGGSLRRQSVGGACDHEDHPGRVSFLRVQPLRTREHLRVVSPHCNGAEPTTEGRDWPGCAELRALR